MKQEKKSDVAVLLDYAGSYRGLTFLGLGLSAASMLCSMMPYICIWLAVRDLIAAAPDWTKAQSVSRYGWMAFAFAAGGIALYFAGLMCTHLAAFRTAANIRKRGVAHMMRAPLGYFDANASGLIRSRLNAGWLVAGHNFRFGHKNAGNAELLREKAAELGMGCDIIPAVKLDGVTVSSTYIRSLLAEGRAREAERFLGHDLLRRDS